MGHRQLLLAFVMTNDEADIFYKKFWEISNGKMTKP